MTESQYTDHLDQRENGLSRWIPEKSPSLNTFNTTAGLGAGGEGDDRGWDGWMVSLTRWSWVSVNSGSWWWTGRPGVLRFMGSQRVGHVWATDLISDLILIMNGARGYTTNSGGRNCISIFRGGEDPRTRRWVVSTMICDSAFLEWQSLGTSERKQASKEHPVQPLLFTKGENVLQKRKGSFKIIHLLTERGLELQSPQ